MKLCPACGAVMKRVLYSEEKSWFWSCDSCSCEFSANRTEENERLGVARDLLGFTGEQDTNFQADSS